MNAKRVHQPIPHAPIAFPTCQPRRPAMAPFLAVCSSRPDRPCAQAQAFATRVRRLGTPAAAEAFLRTLDVTLAERLKPDRRPTR